MMLMNVLQLADVYNGKYDLTGLYKIKDYWDIRNKLNKRLLMNMCGGLNLPPGNPCSGKLLIGLKVC